MISWKSSGRSMPHNATSDYRIAVSTGRSGSLRMCAKSSNAPTLCSHGLRIIQYLYATRAPQPSVILCVVEIWRSHQRATGVPTDTTLLFGLDGVEVDSVTTQAGRCPLVLLATADERARCFPECGVQYYKSQGVDHDPTP
jgi:hypothetical protein